MVEYQTEYTVHIALELFSTHNVGMAFLDCISVCVLHIPHRPKLSVASFSFLNLLPSLPSVLQWYEVERVGWEQVGVVLGSRKYVVGMGCAS